MSNHDQLKQKLKNLSSQDLSLLKKKLAKKKNYVATKDLKFSLFFFSDSGSNGTNGKYELLLESAKIADREGFHAIWVPERHFHEFGGPYPNPTILLSALAMITNQIRLHSGSIVIPLHHPMRVAEDWSMLDNLSNGRIGLSCASGWNRDDFILSSSFYDERKDVTFRDIESIRKLWSGEKVAFVDKEGREAAVKLFPDPVQQTLPIWITSAGNPETWRMAGKLGAHVLTGLMEQTIPELGSKIALYHESLKEHGYDPANFDVSVMLHTYVHQDLTEIKTVVKPALTDYLKKHLSMYEKHINSAQAIDVDVSMVTEQDKAALIELGFNRYFNHNALIGDQEKCSRMASELQAVGVTEICCLVNFGLDHSTIIDGLKYLTKLKNECVLVDAEV